MLFVFLFVNSEYMAPRPPQTVAIHSSFHVIAPITFFCGDFIGTNVSPYQNSCHCNYWSVHSLRKRDSESAFKSSHADSAQCEVFTPNHYKFSEQLLRNIFAVSCGQ